MRLSNKLKCIETYPFHMPGHKRNKEFNIPCSDIDITEIDGFDNLHNPCEIIMELENDIAEIFESRKSIISVNGSTCGILSAVCAVSNKGDKIIIARNCHKSVYNACFINELDIIYIEPEFNAEFAAYGKVTQEAVDKAIADNPDSCAVVITSPTYEGVISEIKCDIPLIVDSAHGAHFGFSDYLPKRANGDIVIQSLHKTLPCLTQTAVVHINNELFIQKVKMYMDIFESSSPSYILLSSVDRCIDFLKNSDNYFKNHKENLDYFYREIKNIPNINLMKNDDISRIIISHKNLSGTQLAEALRNDYAIEVEGATINYIILISTICDTREGFERLLNALKNIDCKSEFNVYSNKPQLPLKHCKANEISDTQITQLELAENKIAAEYIFAYPPGVPIIVPGEIFSCEIINHIKKMIENGVNIISDSNSLPNSVLTKAEQ